MFSGINNSKEVIKSRMLKHALSYWNIKNTEDLDPIVKLILEALSTELHNLGNDIRDTEVRLLEKIANLLAPELLTCPGPAHAILHASPVEAQEELSETVHFYAQKNVSSKQDEVLDKKIDIFFTPVDKIRLFNAHISYIASSTHLFVCDTLFDKQPAAQAMGSRYGDNNVLWLGLSIDEKISNINNLFFHFDWKHIGHELSDLNYQLLPLCKWYINDVEINTTEGIPFEKRPGSDHFSRNLSEDYDVLALIEKDIKNYYHRKFVTVSGDLLNNIGALKQAYPNEFKNIFADMDLQKLETKLLWFKIVFPEGIKQGALDDVFVYTNTFPVINRQLNELKYRLKGGSNIIPLKITGQEQFLSVRSFSDESHQFRSTPFRKTDEEETGTYTIRNGGVERFDGRNAKEFISYLLELLRSESAAFSAYGSDFIASTLKEMNQRIALMEQKTRALAHSSTEIPHYIIAKPYEGNELMYAEYWTTLAETANSLRSGTRLQEYNGTKISGDSLFLISTAMGGKNRLKPEERVNAFKYGLITRNRIITKEDIRNFCFAELGNRISKVSVEKGFEMPAHPRQSFLRTIDITLTLLPSEKLNNEGWQVLSDQLKLRLQSRSGMSNHYRIFFNK